MKTFGITLYYFTYCDIEQVAGWIPWRLSQMNRAHISHKCDTDNAENINLMVIMGLSGVQFGLKSYNWLTQWDDRIARVWFV